MVQTIYCIINNVKKGAFKYILFILRLGMSCKCQLYNPIACRPLKWLPAYLDKIQLVGGSWSRWGKKTWRFHVNIWIKPHITGYWIYYGLLNHTNLVIPSLQVVFNCKLVCIFSCCTVRMKDYCKCTCSVYCTSWNCHCMKVSLTEDCKSFHYMKLTFGSFSLYLYSY